jgi:hypothetical protein
VRKVQLWNDSFLSLLTELERTKGDWIHGLAPRGYRLSLLRNLGFIVRVVQRWGRVVGFSDSMTLAALRFARCRILRS